MKHNNFDQNWLKMLLNSVVAHINSRLAKSPKQEMPSDNEINRFLNSKNLHDSKVDQGFRHDLQLLMQFCKDVKSGEFDVPAKVYALLATVVLYVIFPFDLLPEAFLGPIGYLDDALLIQWLYTELGDTFERYKRFRGDGGSESFAA